MNTQAYIASGILEEYVLGTVSQQEKQEVECLSKIYPEVKEELGKLEQALEGYALEFQTAPPIELKDKIFGQMNFGPELINEETSIPVVEDNTVELHKETKVVPLSTPTASFWPKFAVAAAILLAVLSGWAITEKNKLQVDKEQLASENETLKSISTFQTNLAQLYRNPDVKVVRMPGVEKSPESLVVALWNSKTNEVLLDVQNLPKAPSGKQYQLWSIVDGVPVDMGLLENDFKDKVLQMKTAKASAAAFAITLEKEGGNPGPTLSEMYVMGKV